MTSSINGTSAPVMLPAGVDEAQVIARLTELVKIVDQLNAALRQSHAGAAATTTGGGAPAKGGNAAGSSGKADAKGGTSKFVVSSYNVLGNSHTVKGGNAPGYASGAQRIKGVVQGLKQNDVDVVGLQEFQKPQQKAFRKLTDEYDMAGGGDKLNDNVVAWRKDRFKLVQKKSVEIPYFGGKMRKMPVVKLEDRTTGKQAWFINVHNPAHTEYESSRRRSEQIENKLVEQLRKDGTPVYLVGDFNDRGQTKQAIEKPGQLEAADFKQKAVGIDWIFASKDVQLSDARYDRSQRKKTSDHSMAVATAQM
jgi:endonuclease/exonuclease/phosphatase family metal-dependent hydrolase